MASIRTLICFLFICNVLSGLAQDRIPKVRLTFIEKEKTIPELIELLEESSGLSFAYSSNLIPDKKISIHLEEALLSEVLDELLLGLNIRYQMVEGKVVLVRADPEMQSRFTVSGFVKDESTGEYLIGASIQVVGSGIGAVTNPYGFFSLTLPADRYTLRVSYVGYEDQVHSIKLNEDLSSAFSIKPNLSMLSELVVTPSDSILRLEDRQSGSVSIDQQRIQNKPIAFGEADLIKSLDVIPGVQLFRDGSTFFNVRGGDRDQNQILVDEAPIYNPAHLLGLFSSITPEVIKDAKLYKGNAPAEYGGRVSSIMDIKTKDGNMNKVNLNGSVGLVSGRLSLEGPIVKEKSSFFLSGRRSYIGSLLRGLGVDFDQLGFSDLTGKVNLRLNQNNRLFFSAFSSNDQYRANGGLGWKNTAGTIRWNHLINNRLFANTTVYASRYAYELTSGDGLAWKNNINTAALKSDFTYFGSPESTLRFGFQFGGHHFNPGNIEAFDEQFDFVPKRNASEVSFYFSQEKQLNDNFQLTYGLRLSNWINFGRTIEYEFDQEYSVVDSTIYNTRTPYNHYTNLEPRFGLSWHPGSRHFIKLNYTRSVQYVNLISNSISPFNNLEVWLPSSINIKPQSGNQWSLSWITAGTSWSLELEGYYKLLANQLDYTNQAELLLNPHLEGELRAGRSWAHGIEATLSKISGKLTGILSYNYSRSFRRIEGINGGRVYPTLWDRPHQLTTSINYNYSQRSTLTTVFLLSSGPPSSRPTSFYSFAGRTVPIYSDRHNSRLPAYHRFDISWRHRLNKSAGKFSHFLMISIFNFYGQKNSILESFNKIQVDEETFRVPTATNTGMIIPTYRFVYHVVPSLTYSFNL